MQKDFQLPRKSPFYEVYPLKVVDEEEPNNFYLLLLNEDDKNYNRPTSLISQDLCDHRKRYIRRVQLSVKGILQAFTISRRKLN